jgi:hypothetical protein
VKSDRLAISAAGSTEPTLGERPSGHSYRHRIGDIPPRRPLPVPAGAVVSHDPKPLAPTGTMIARRFPPPWRVVENLTECFKILPLPTKRWPIFRRQPCDHGRRPVGRIPTQKGGKRFLKVGGRHPAQIENRQKRIEARPPWQDRRGEANFSPACSRPPGRAPWHAGLRHAQRRSGLRARSDGPFNTPPSINRRHPDSRIAPIKPALHNTLEPAPEDCALAETLGARTREH